MTPTEAPPAAPPQTEPARIAVPIPRRLYDAARQSGMSEADIQRTVQDAAWGALADEVGTREAKRR